MNKIVISLCTLLICEANFFANAQDTSSQLKNKIALNGELLCDTWQIDASYHYFVLPFFGFWGFHRHVETIYCRWYSIRTWMDCGRRL